MNQEGLLPFLFSKKVILYLAIYSAYEKNKNCTVKNFMKKGGSMKQGKEFNHRGHRE